MISHNKISFYKDVYIIASSLKIEGNTRIKVKSASLNYLLPLLGCMYYVMLFEYPTINLILYQTLASFSAESGFKLGLFSEEGFCLRLLLQNLVGESGTCHWVARRKKDGFIIKDYRMLPFSTTLYHCTSLSEKKPLIDRFSSQIFPYHLAEA